MLKLSAPVASAEDAAAKAAKVDGVAWVEPNYLFKPLRADGKKSRRSNHATIGIEATPTDPRYLPDQSWYFDRIEAPAAWDIQNLATRVSVAVIDDGILYEHVDLEDRMWENDDETGPGAFNDGEDDDNNGFVDDANGWDFFEDDNDPFPYDDPEAQRNGFAGDRGTFVAGVVGAEANNAEGISGICWDVDLMNLRVFDERSPIFGSTLDIAAAVDYAIEEEADVILMAWVIDSRSLILQNAIIAARD
jgi:subtilisin family serine protease